MRHQQVEILLQQQDIKQQQAEIASTAIGKRHNS